MNHQFNVELAEKYGLEEAILIDTIYLWVHYNECNDEMQKNGRTWCYSTAKGFAKYVPYMNAQKIRRILLKMEEKGIILIGNFNKAGMNQTLWYAFTDEAIKELDKNGYHFSKVKNGVFKNEKSEYTINEYNNKNNNKKSTDVDEKEKVYVSENGETSFLEPPTNEREQRYLEWVTKEYPRMMKMPVPLTYKQFVELREKYGEELVIAKIEALDNDKRYYQKKINAYRTINGWCRVDSIKQVSA